MQVDHLMVQEEDIALVAQYALAEAYDAHIHDKQDAYQNALNIGVALEGYAANGTNAHALQDLTAQAEKYSMKTARDIQRLAVWMMFT